MNIAQLISSQTMKQQVQTDHSRFPDQSASENGFLSLMRKHVQVESNGQFDANSNVTNEDNSTDIFGANNHLVLFQNTQLTQLLSNESSEEQQLEIDLELITEINELLIAWMNGEINIDDLPEEIALLLEDAAVISQLAQQIMQLLNNTNQSQEEMKSIADKLYQLFKEIQQSDSDLRRNMKWEQFIQSTSSKEASDIWNDIVSAYERRSKLASQQMYQTDATITRETVTNWLEQALSRHFVEDHQAINSSATQAPMPMSHIQQYTIFASSTDRVEAISEELMNKLTTIIKNSQFIKNPGLNQLSIRIQPEHLGDMMIRFVQVNGEMTVKFLVSSQFTKQLLESNMHQLKSMFAPHQIVIERDTTIVSESEQLQEEHEQLQEQEENLQDEQQFEEEQEEVNAEQFQEFLEMFRREEVVT